MHSYSISQLIQQLRAKTFSATELTQHFLDRIKQFNPAQNSFITICEEQALKQAQQADQRLASDHAHPLTGIPIAHKDIFCTEGIKSSCGSKMLDNFIAPYDATLVANGHQAGMVMLGKLNMDEFAMGSSNENSFYGPVTNPWDPLKIPGGSSGGSAAAVTARLTPLATATDTGGSIRQPAAMCGVSGLKPTYGRVSRYGMIAFASSLDQAGPMAASAEDLAYAMNVLAGFDEKDSTSVNHPVPDYTVDLNNPIKGLKIGIATECFGKSLDHDVAKKIEEAMLVLKKCGAEFVDIHLPHAMLSTPAYYILAPAEASSNLARFDGVRYGYRCENPRDLNDLYQRSRGEAFGDEVKRRIMLGTYALSAGYYDAYYVKAQKIRRLICEDFKQALQQVDVIISPATPTTAFDLGSKTNNPVSMYHSDIYTIAINLAGLPAISVPCGFSKNLPVGLQLIGNYFAEQKLLNIAHLYQQNTDWHQRVPTQFQ